MTSPLRGLIPAFIGLAIFCAVAAATDPLAEAIPDESIARLPALLQPSGTLPKTQAERDQAAHARRTKRQQAIELGYELTDQYPKAPNLAVVQQYMLAAALLLHEADANEVNRQQLITVANDVLQSADAPRQRLQADVALFGLALTDSADDDRKTQAALVTMVGRYHKTAAEPNALIAAATLAGRRGWHDLFRQFVARLAESHPDHGQAARFLARIGHPIPFQTELTDLEGQTVTLPDDLRGKVVVVEFWATWCAQSKRCEPYLRRLREAFADRGVEIVTISLDPPDQLAALKAHVAQEQLHWIHTYSGLGLADPTFTHYRLDETPSIWILDRNGNIFTDNALFDRADPAAPSALSNIERNVLRALALDNNEPTTK